MLWNPKFHYHVSKTPALVHIVTCYLLTRRIILWVLDVMLDLLDTRQAELQSLIPLPITSHEPTTSSSSSCVRIVAVARLVVSADT
jgi:hypothetical protein